MTMISSSEFEARFEAAVLLFSIRTDYHADILPAGNGKFKLIPPVEEEFTEVLKKAAREHANGLKWVLEHEKEKTLSGEAILQLKRAGFIVTSKIVCTDTTARKCTCRIVNPKEE